MTKAKSDRNIRKLESKIGFEEGDVRINIKSRQIESKVRTV